MNCWKPRCQCCGRFISMDGSSWAHIYDFVSMGLDHEVYRCASCTVGIGPAQSNAKPHDGIMTPYQGIYGPATLGKEG